MSISALLDRRLTIQRQHLVADPSGGAMRTFVTVLPNIACSIVPASAVIVADYARRDMVVDHHIYTTADLDSAIAGGLRLGDRIIDGSTNYLVKSVMKSANAAVSGDVVYQINCERRMGAS